MIRWVWWGLWVVLFGYVMVSQAQVPQDAPFVPPPNGSNTAIQLNIPSDNLSLDDMQTLSQLNKSINGWLSENPMVFTGVFLSIACLIPLLAIFLFFRRNMVLSLIGTVLLAPFGAFLSLAIFYWTSGLIATSFGIDIAAFYPNAPVFSEPVNSLGGAIWRGVVSGFLPVVGLVVAGAILFSMSFGRVVGKEIWVWSDGTETLHVIREGDSPSLRGCIGFLFLYIPMLLWVTPLVAVIYSVLQYAYESGLRQPIYAGREYFITSLALETLWFGMWVVLAIGGLKNGLRLLRRR